MCSGMTSNLWWLRLANVANLIASLYLCYNIILSMSRVIKATQLQVNTEAVLEAAIPDLTETEIND